MRRSSAAHIKKKTCDVAIAKLCTMCTMNGLSKCDELQLILLIGSD